ncbi:MAG: dihydropteroate synthase [Desulfurococcaceae archaeon]
MAEGLLARYVVGDGHPVRIMGVVNVSPESFYKGSVARRPEEAASAAARMAEEGADVIDVGGMSTAPYLDTAVPVDVELDRVAAALRAIKGSVDVPISVDTYRARVAEEALRLGAEVVNDVTGLKGDPEMLRVVLDYSPSLVICAKEREPRTGLDPVARTVAALSETLDLLASRGFDLRKVIVDPCIGFHRHPEIPWYVWDLAVLSRLGELKAALKRPVAIGVSRKSFIGVLLGRERPEERLYGTIAFTTIAVLSGAHVVRAHDVSAARDAARAVESFARHGIRLKIEYPP